jgi:hypothetical protein
MYRSTFFSTSALVGDERSASRTSRFAPGNHCIALQVWLMWRSGYASTGTRNEDVKKTYVLRRSVSDIHNLTPWPQSTSELYLRSDRGLSAKLVPTFAEVTRDQRGGSLRPYSRFSRPFQVYISQSNAVTRCV